MKIYIRDDRRDTNYMEISADELKRLCDNAFEMKLDDIDADGNFYFLVH